MSRRRDPAARTYVLPLEEYRATFERYLRERERGLAWDIDPHHETDDTLTVEAAADRLEQKLRE